MYRGPFLSERISSAVSLFTFSLAIDNVLSILGRTNSESVLKSRLKTINDYCNVSHMTLVISRSCHMTLV